LSNNPKGSTRAYVTHRQRRCEGCTADPLEAIETRGKEMLEDLLINTELRAVCPGSVDWGSLRKSTSDISLSINRESAQNLSRNPVHRESKSDKFVTTIAALGAPAMIHGADWMSSHGHKPTNLAKRGHRWLHAEAEERQPGFQPDNYSGTFNVSDTISVEAILAGYAAE